MHFAAFRSFPFAGWVLKRPFPCQSFRRATWQGNKGSLIHLESYCHSEWQPEPFDTEVKTPAAAIKVSL
jgi:hypothetical protein